MLCIVSSCLDLVYIYICVCVFAFVCLRLLVFMYLNIVTFVVKWQDRGACLGRVGEINLVSLWLRENPGTYFGFPLVARWRISKLQELCNYTLVSGELVVLHHHVGLRRGRRTCSPGVSNCET